MNLERLDLEKYEALEQERNETIADSGFQHWVSTLGVSSSYSDREGIIRANELNAQYDYKTLSSGRMGGIRSLLSILK